MIEITTNSPVIRIEFAVVEGDNVFCDALNLTQAEYDALKPGELEERQAVRFANWKQNVAVASVRVPTTEEIEAQIAQLDEQKAELEAVKVDLVAKVGKVKA